jgi:PHD/YefM family antitoxin component YafN of YafNO toxin-antitoxin module
VRKAIMLKTKYDVLVRNGKDRFVVVPEKDYQAMRQRLEDEADFRAIESSKKRNAGKRLVSHAQVMRAFGLRSSEKKRKT